jgi:hypothetical protein
MVGCRARSMMVAVAVQAVVVPVFVLPVVIGPVDIAPVGYRGMQRRPPRRWGLFTMRQPIYRNPFIAAQLQQPSDSSR